MPYFKYDIRFTWYRLLIITPTFVIDLIPKNVKKIIFALLLLPAVVSAQSTLWYSGGGVVYIDRTFNHTGYGAEINANAELINGFSLGAGIGISKIPILPNSYIPVYGKATFFPWLNESNLSSFATVEVGYGIYNENDFRKGHIMAYGGVGFSLNTRKFGSPFASFGYGVYGYTTYGEPATQRRATIKFGIMLNRPGPEY